MQTGQANLQTYSPTDDAARIERALVSFGKDFKPMVFDKYSKAYGIEKSTSEVAPTFHDIIRDYSEEAVLFWMRYHIADTFVFLGIFDQSSKYQIRQTAELILQHEIFGQLTLSEFLCFLQRFKQGRYGNIYNSNHPNPQEFLKCLQPFWNELTHWRAKHADKVQQEKISRDLHTAPTPDEQKKIDEIKERLKNKFKM